MSRGFSINKLGLVAGEALSELLSEKIGGGVDLIIEPSLLAALEVITSLAELKVGRKRHIVSLSLANCST